MNIESIANGIACLTATSAPKTPLSSGGPTYLCTDSRSVFDPANTVFAAIRTDVNDGHRYIPHLYSQGVRAFIVEELRDEYREMDAMFFCVPSVEDCILSIGRRSIPRGSRRILVTGSHGKTTMKELLYHALLPLARVARSPRSWNSSLGIALALQDICGQSEDSEPEIIIAEAGIDGLGQAAKLSPITELFEIGIITGITDEHDAAFPSHRDKILEKIALLSHCSIIIYDDSDPMTAELLQTYPYPGPTPELIAVGEPDSRISRDKAHMMAIKVAEILGFSDSEHSRINAIPPVSTRRDIRSSTNGNILIRDNFTTDLRSLRESLDFMRRQATPAKEPVLIAGSLLHGSVTRPATEKLYSEAVSMARMFGVRRIIAVGDEWREHAPDSGDYITFIPDFESFIDYNVSTPIKDSQILVFGSNADGFDRLFGSLQSASHETTLEIDLDALVSNYNYYRHLVPTGTGIVAMVKASAYGMGAIEIGKTLQSQGAAALAVAVIDEGIALRKAGITMPVIVLNPVTDRYPSLFDYRLEPAVFSLDELDRMISEAEKYGTTDYPIHIKFDTGMHRVGFLDEHIEKIVERMSAQKGNAVRIASAFSHLATADCLDMDDYTHGQIDRFYSMIGRLRELIGYDFKRHILNTAGMMRFADCGPYEMGRLGIGLYGISPVPGADNGALKPVAAFRSHIISLKHWPAGTPIGYGCKGRTTRDSIIATVPVGYADGINRRFSNGGAAFIVRGTRCPTIGNICMDLCMIDVTDAHGAEMGDSVEIFGPEAPIETLAEALGTIPYEILTSVSPRVRRSYFRK